MANRIRFMLPLAFAFVLGAAAWSALAAEPSSAQDPVDESANSDCSDAAPAASIVDIRWGGGG